MVDEPLVVSEVSALHQPASHQVALLQLALGLEASRQKASHLEGE